MDHTHPVISFVQIEPEAVRDGQTVAISLQVFEDLSGLAHVFGSVKAPDGKNYPIFFDEKALENKFRIPKYATPGTWKIRYLYVQDKAGNKKKYPEDSEIADFQIVGQFYR